jgi:hypothetical protein
MTMTTKIAIAAGLGLALAGCSQDADIGIAIDPVTCTPAAAGSVEGHVSYQGYEHDFGVVDITVYQPTDAPTFLSLSDRELILRLGFLCGPAERATYNVISDGPNQQAACPFEVNSSLVGQIEYLPARRGTLIVDESASCFAGRFHVELGNDAGDTGDLVGWFSTPWQ